MKADTKAASGGECGPCMAMSLQSGPERKEPTSVDQVGHARRRHYNVGLKGAGMQDDVFTKWTQRQGRERAQARDSFGIAEFHAVHLLQHLVPDLFGSRTLAHATHPSAVFQDHTTAP